MHHWYKIFEKGRHFEYTKEKNCFKMCLLFFPALFTCSKQETVLLEINGLCI